MSNGTFSEVAGDTDGGGGPSKRRQMIQCPLVHILLFPYLRDHYDCSGEEVDAPPGLSCTSMGLPSDVSGNVGASCCSLGETAGSQAPLSGFWPSEGVSAWDLDIRTASS